MLHSKTSIRVHGGTLMKTHHGPDEGFGNRMTQIPWMVEFLTTEMKTAENDLMYWHLIGPCDFEDFLELNVFNLSYL